MPPYCDIIILSDDNCVESIDANIFSGIVAVGQEYLKMVSFNLI